MTRKLGVWAGVGVNAGAMIGIGVFISAGFMAETMGPGAILLAWLAGGVLAIAGARAYAELAALIPRSGGEYRYLADLFHPWLGAFAGWASLLAGFAAPVAANAKVMSSFAGTLAPGTDFTHRVAVVIAIVTLLHAFDLGLSHAGQNVMALAKVLVVGGFIVIGLAFGAHELPAYTPRTAGTLATVGEQFGYVVYAYIGWNSAAYAAEEFRDPARTVPRSMVISAVAVTVVYLLVNFIFVANLTPEAVAAFGGSDKDRVTFGHVIIAQLIGPAGGKVMSVLVIVALASAISAMTLVGPRVYQAMARDGFLPRAFAGKADEPPVFSVLLQGALALVIYYTHKLADLVNDISVILTVVSALAVATLFKVKSGWLPRACAALFIALSAFMVVRIGNFLWLGGLVLATTVAFVVARRRLS